MPKKILQDVKIKHPPTRREDPFYQPRPGQGGQDRQEEQEIIVRKINRNDGVRARKTRFRFWGVAVVSILFFLFALSYVFSQVSVSVVPKMREVAISENLVASKDGVSGNLPFNLIAIDGVEEKTLEATEEKNVAEKATGAVIIYNAFGTAPQLLSIDTRLEGSNGKIYKTKKQIYVPGMKGSTPGSIEVGIYAAESGPEYNSEPLDFKVFGFKGTPKYAKFYARSKGPIEGGFRGKMPVISEEQKIKTTNDLKAALRTKLFKKAADQIPKGFVLFKNAVFLDSSSQAPVSAAENTLSLKEKGTLYGILFDQSKLAKKIAQDVIKEYDGRPVLISNIDDLVFTLPNRESFSFADVKNINFTLSGKANIVWKVDQQKLATDLLGKNKNDFRTVLQVHPEIESADLIISPFWKRTLPGKSKDIKINAKYPVGTSI